MDDDLRPFERPAKNEYDDLGDDEEGGWRQIKPRDKILDDGVAAKGRKHGRNVKEPTNSHRPWPRCAR